MKRRAFLATVAAALAAIALPGLPSQPAPTVPGWSDLPQYPPWAPTKVADQDAFECTFRMYWNLGVMRPDQLRLPGL